MHADQLFIYLEILIIVFTASEFGNCKSVFIEIFNTRCKILFSVVYMTNGNIDCFEDLHSYLLIRYSKLVIVGDFNCNLFNPNKPFLERLFCSRCYLLFFQTFAYLATCQCIFVLVGYNALLYRDMLSFLHPCVLKLKVYLTFSNTGTSIMLTEMIRYFRQNIRFLSTFLNSKYCIIFIIILTTLNIHFILVIALLLYF